MWNVVIFLQYTYVWYMKNLIAKLKSSLLLSKNEFLMYSYSLFKKKKKQEYMRNSFLSKNGEHKNLAFKPLIIYKCVCVCV